MINSFFRSSFMISNSLFQLFIFLSGAPSYFNYIISKLHLNHCKASPGVLFNFPIRLIILLLPEFFMEALHGGSSRIRFILQLFFKISLGVKIRQAILKKLTWCSTHVLFWGVQVFFILHSEVQFFLLSFEVVLCHSWQFPFMLHDSHVVKNEVF